MLYIGLRSIKILCASTLIRINHRALLNAMYTTLLKNNIKAIGWSTIKVKRKIYPMIKMSKSSNHLVVTEHEMAQNCSLEPKKNLEVELVKSIEDSISVQILAQPPPEQPILADVIFVHGLHGNKIILFTLISSVPSIGIIVSFPLFC